MPLRLSFAHFYKALFLGIMVVLLVACGAASNIPYATQRTPQPEIDQSEAVFHTEITTSDGKFLVQFTITPNRFGSNMFVVHLADVQSGQAVTNEQVQLFTTMLDMDMATGVVILQPDGAGSYSAQGSLVMDGNWDIHIQMLDDTAVHVAKLQVFTPA